MNIIKRGLIGLMFSLVLLSAPSHLMADEPKLGDTMIDEFGIEFCLYCSRQVYHGNTRR